MVGQRGGRLLLDPEDLTRSLSQEITRQRGVRGQVP